MNQAVDDCVDLICTKGCQTVRDDIHLLEQSIEIPETRGLNPDEINWVLNQLREVMAAYQETCPIPEAK